MIITRPKVIISPSRLGNIPVCGNELRRVVFSLTVINDVSAQRLRVSVFNGLRFFVASRRDGFNASPSVVVEHGTMSTPPRARFTTRKNSNIDGNSYLGFLIS